jgi:hypothetical protein
MGGSFVPFIHHDPIRVPAAVPAARTSADRDPPGPSASGRTTQRECPKTVLVLSDMTTTILVLSGVTT